MRNIFTRDGANLHRKRISMQTARTKAAGQQVGEEAGPNCDWHDNFGYEDAKRRLELESRLLSDLTREMDGAEIIEVEEQYSRVNIGNTVIVDVNGEEREYTIGGNSESLARFGLIPYNTPLGSAIIGHSIGDVVVKKIGPKELEIEIIYIFPPSKKYYDLLRKLERSVLEGD